MKKTTRKTTSKPRATKAIRDLDVKRAKDGTVRGGDKRPTENCSLAFAKVEIEYKP